MKLLQMSDWKETAARSHSRADSQRKETYAATETTTIGDAMSDLLVDRFIHHGVVPSIFSGRRRIDARLLLTHLAAYATDDGTHVKPTVDALAHETGLSRRTVQRLLHDMADLGLLRETRAAQRHGGRTWSLNIAALGMLGCQARQLRGVRV
jgi:AraC-like DNA-binding protein